MINTAPVQNINEICRPMKRGQITIPIKIRKKLKITPKTWLWIKLIRNKILIEPVEKGLSSNLLSDYLLSSAGDLKAYWRDEDAKNIEKINKKSKKRLKKLI